MSAPAYRTAEMKALEAEVGRLGHAQNPFLDARYSIGGFYPVTDFTLVIADWLRGGRVEAIKELWCWITADRPADRVVLQKALAATMPDEFGFDEEMAAEVKAVHLLGQRLALYEQPGAASFTVGRVLATRLASTEWQPPCALRAELEEWAEKEAVIVPEIHPPERKRLLAQRAMVSLSQSSDEPMRNVKGWMRQMPPMARLVISEYFHRADGRIHPELYYGERKYGCNEEINRQFVDWIGCFSYPPDEVPVPRAVTKDHLRDALARIGVKRPASATREALIAEARKSAGVLSAIYERDAREYRVVKAGWEASLTEWARRVHELPPVALAVLRPLAEQTARAQVVNDEWMAMPRTEKPDGATEIRFNVNLGATGNH